MKDLFDLSAPWRLHAACLGHSEPFFIDDMASRTVHPFPSGVRLT